MRDRLPSVAQGAEGVQSCAVLIREMQQTGQKGSSLILSVQTFKKCPFMRVFLLCEETPMPRTGIHPEHMEQMRARRRPFSDPRAGRLLSSIEFAFFLSGGEPISTTELVKSCYPAEHILGGLKSWQRSNVVRAAWLVANPIGRASTRGRPLVYHATCPITLARKAVARHASMQRAAPTKSSNVRRRKTSSAAI
jgi:hypothetical protein